MRLPQKIILGAVATLVFAWLFGAGASRVYFQPHETLTSEITSTTERIDRYTSALADATRVETQIESFVNRTLGGDLESVDHRLRARLNRIAEQLELADIVVGTGRAVSRQTPAKRRFSRRESVLRDEIDFVELSSWVSVTGSLAQVLNLADRIEAEPWIKRIDQLNLDPKDNGETFSATVRLTTLFLPGREPRKQESLPYDPSRMMRFASFINVNPFRIPEKTQQTSPTLAVATTDALAQWTITGIVEGPDGLEVWLLNTVSGASKILLPGDVFETVSLISAQDDSVIFQSQSLQFVIPIGGNLSDRSRPKQ